MRTMLAHAMCPATALIIASRAPMVVKSSYGMLGGCAGITQQLFERRQFLCTRGCGCIGHPAFPAPSVWRAMRFSGKARAHRAARTRMHVPSSPASVIPGWSEGPDLRCAIAHRGISRFRVRCCASPRNDGLSWIASRALAMTSWPSFETHRCRHAPRDEVVAVFVGEVKARLRRVHHLCLDRAGGQRFALAHPTTT
jgi:hypothetical protein